LTAADAPAYFAFRLAGLAEAPLAFGRSAEEYRHEPLETVASGLGEIAGERVTLGAFQGHELVGAMTAVRESTLKRRHKGNVYAVYVSPAARGQRVGETLLSALLHWAEAVPGLEQLHLAVSVTQEAARRLYLRHGFQVYGLEPKALRVNGVDVDDEWMVRFL
jgi:ribosomal protein S18 acetylase RimI-like enzyme